MSDAVGQYVRQQFRNAQNNRKDMQTKWETNRTYFNGNFGLMEGQSNSVNPQWKKDEGKGWRSTTWPQATHNKVMSAMALITDTVLAGGVIPYMLKPSLFDPDNIRIQNAEDAEITNRETADMKKLIDQQLSDSKADRAFSKLCLSMALYGKTYAKLQIRQMKRSGWMQQAPDVEGITDFSRVQQNIPWVKWEKSFMCPFVNHVSLWDIFRDWETDDLSACAFIIHRQIVSNTWLRSKKGKPFFIDDRLDAAIQANKSSTDRTSASVTNNEDTNDMAPALRNLLYRVSTRQYLEYWGRIPRSLVESFEKDHNVNIGPKTPEFDDGDEVEVCVCVTDDETTVRFARTEPEDRPFFEANWEEVGDELISRGIADNCQDMHNVLRGAFRAFEDNKKLSGNVILGLKERYLINKPTDMKPGDQMLISDDCDDARKAIQPIIVPDVGKTLVEVIEISNRFLDDDSMVPRIAQGLPSGSMTAHEASIRQAQSFKYFGMAIRNFDNGIIEPIIEAYYKYNMEDPEVNVGKGNYSVQALGFTSFANKTERVTKMMQWLSLVMQNPKLMENAKFRSVMEELTKALDMDPDQFMMSQEEMAQIPPNPMPELEMKQAEAQAEKDMTQAEKNRAEAQYTMASIQTDGIKTESNLAKVELNAKKMDNDAAKMEMESQRPP